MARGLPVDGGEGAAPSVDDRRTVLRRQGHPPERVAGPGEDLARGILAKLAIGRHLLVLDSAERVLDGVAEVSKYIQSIYRLMRDYGLPRRTWAFTEDKGKFKQLADDWVSAAHLESEYASDSAATHRKRLAQWVGYLHDKQFAVWDADSQAKSDVDDPVETKRVQDHARNELAAAWLQAEKLHPILAAYRAMFPTLFKDASAMPPDLRRHVRYPELLLTLQADVYGHPVELLAAEEGGAFGAALLAAVGIGEWPTVEAACSATVHAARQVKPWHAEAMDHAYARFRRLYPAMKSIGNA